MDRRDFLKNSALILAGAAVDSPLGWVRRLFTTGGWTRQGGLYVQKFALGFEITQEMLEDDLYISQAMPKGAILRYMWDNDKYVVTKPNGIVTRWEDSSGDEVIGHRLVGGVDPSMRVLSSASIETIKTNERTAPIIIP